MKHEKIPRHAPLISTLLSFSLHLEQAHAQNQSVIHPASEQAQGIANLWWVMFWVAAIVFITVIIIMVIGFFRGKLRGEHQLSVAASRNLVITAGMAIPLFTILFLVGGSLTLGRSLSAEPPADALKVRITGWMWWWEIEYLDDNMEVIATTANELHIPTDQAVHLLLESGDVIHSFWVPQLNGKTDMIPGRTNVSWFTANETGTFRGQCAEFCGTQHALMSFLVIAQTPTQFQSWLDNQTSPAKPPQSLSETNGQETFFSAQCHQCHTIRGTEAVGQNGPDLTHIASRLSIAAVTRENNRSHLGGWIANPQGIKPGAKMPQTQLNSTAFLELLDYLQGLE